MIIRNLQRIPILSLALLLINCGNEKRNENPPCKPKTITKKLNANPIKASVQSWFDSISVMYNNTSSNASVRNAVKDSSKKEEWNFDQIVKTDTADYFVYQVGHDVSDGDGLRFVTDSWIYIDTVKRKLYEYQPDGKLLLWNTGQHK